MQAIISSRFLGHLVITGALLWSLVGCAGSQGTARDPPRGRLSPRVVSRLASEYIDSLDTRALKGNLDAFLEKWADKLDHTVALATMRTKEELRDFLRQWSDMFSKWRHVEVRRLVHGNLVAWEGFATGTHRTTGKPLKIPMVMIIEFDEYGKVKMSHVYFDSGVLQQQLLADR